jgi:hypothetical protein
MYNLLEQKVATFVNERKQAGYQQIEWDFYYYSIKAGKYQYVK